MGSSQHKAVTMVRSEAPIRCILCKGFVNINNRKRFEEHLTHEHRVYFHSDLLLGACKLNSVNTEDLTVVKRIMDGMFEENIKLMKDDESAISTDISDSTINMSTSLEELSNDTLTDDNQMEDNDGADLDSYASIPSHLLNEFQKLCDETENDVTTNTNLPDAPLKSDVKFELEYQKPEKKLKTFDCTKCDKTFEISFRLKKHMQNKHNKIQTSSNKKKSNDCPYCKKTFKFELILRRHVQFKCKKKKMAIKKEFACEFCDESYVNFGNLNRHQKYAHKDGEQPESFTYDKKFDMKSTVHTKSLRITPKSLGKMKNRVYTESVV